MNSSNTSALHRALAMLFIPILLFVAACQLTTPATKPAETAVADGATLVTDVVGRSVAIKLPIKTMILTEARMLYTIAALEPENPFQRIIGWPDDLRTADLDAYEKYRAKFPKLADIPIFGSASQGQFSAEKAIELKPDVLVLNFDSYERAKESGLIDQLARVGIPSVVTDFRQYPLENTVPSTILLGRLMGKEARAQQVVDFYMQQVSPLYARIEKVKAAKPNAFIYRAAGLLECCATFGRGNLGLLFERAGGKNIGSDLLPGWSGTLNPEKLLSTDPDLIIVTGSNWKFSPGQTGGYVPLGYDTKPEDARAALKALTNLPGWSNLKAVKSGRLYAIWHQFYNSPYHFAALQQFAKWAYPEEFKDIDPEKALREFHEKFLPVAYSGTFWVSVTP